MSEKSLSYLPILHSLTNWFKCLVQLYSMNYIQYNWTVYTIIIIIIFRSFTYWFVKLRNKTILPPAQILIISENIEKILRKYCENIVKILWKYCVKSQNKGRIQECWVRSRKPFFGQFLRRSTIGRTIVTLWLRFTRAV